MREGAGGRVDVGARFDARADTYDASAAHRWQAGVAAEVAGVSPEERVLDVATGTGLVLRALPAPTRPGLRVGVDLSPGLLAVAARELPSAAWVRADGGHLPLADGGFDVVTCVAGISYLEPDVVLPEWRRVLDRTGRLVVSLPADRGLTAFALLQDAARAVGVDLREPNAGLGARDRLKHAGRRHGLVLREVVEATYREALTGRADEVFDHHLDQGLAEPLRRAGADVRRAALETYRDLYREAAGAGAGQQRLLFACWTAG